MVRHDLISIRNTRGFSLIELLVTLAVVAALSSMMFPAFARVHGMAQRLMCQNNMRNLYIALDAFEQSTGGARPDSLHVASATSQRPTRPQEFMALSAENDSGVGSSFVWDGLGKLWRSGGKYIGDASSFYCPAHKSVHTLSNYDTSFSSNGDGTTGKRSFSAPKGKVYGNYHYWEAWNKAVAARRGAPSGKDAPSVFKDVLLTDGLRTQLDLNHSAGCNTLKTDGSIEWIGGTTYDLAVRALPVAQEEASPAEQASIFNQLVADFNKLSR
jgi:prepilin-type N-terminal cleavage/methylation domain-containing protein